MRCICGGGQASHGTPVAQQGYFVFEAARTASPVMRWDAGAQVLHRRQNGGLRGGSAAYASRRGRGKGTHLPCARHPEGRRPPRPPTPLLPLQPPLQDYALSKPQTRTARTSAAQSMWPFAGRPHNLACRGGARKQAGTHARTAARPLALVPSGSLIGVRADRLEFPAGGTDRAAPPMQ